ncbi:hypothetical protein HBB16_18190 [Pseudonocardia sp. MCCB 268]|nr:hypothetical protein [Pseudonocardia cytotoxica]
MIEAGERERRAQNCLGRVDGRDREHDRYRRPGTALAPPPTPQSYTAPPPSSSAHGRPGGTGAPSGGAGATVPGRTVPTGTTPAAAAQAAQRRPLAQCCRGPQHARQSGQHFFDDLGATR